MTTQFAISRHLDCDRQALVIGVRRTANAAFALAEDHATRDERTPARWMESAPNEEDRRETVGLVRKWEMAAVWAAQPDILDSTYLVHEFLAD